MPRLPLVLFAPLLALSGCAIHQTVKPVDHFDEKQVCVVDNPSVRPAFLDAIRQSLTRKGYSSKVLPESSSLIECPVTLTYSANWRWDLAMYMSYADIKIYRNAKPAGEAKYDASHGGGNLGKFIDADKKVIELMDQLMPGGAGS